MTPEQKLAELRAEAETLKAKAATPEFSDEDSQRALEIVKEIQDTEAVIARKAAASKALGSIQVTEPVQDNDADKPAAKSGGTLGERFINSDAMKAFRQANPSTVSKGTPIDVKAAGLGSFRRKLLTSEQPGNAAPVRTGEVDDLVYRPERRLLDVITRGTTNLPWFQYRQIIAKTNNATIVPEATATSGSSVADGLKPISGLTTQTAEARAYTYADGMEVTNQELSDDGIIQSLIDSTLAENLEIALEYFLLNGDSDEEAEQPDGILNTSGVLHQPYATNAVTTVRKAITRLQTTSGAQIKGVLFNPEDDEAWDLFTDANGRFFSGGPFGSGPRTAWGYERIVCPVLPQGTAIIGDFSQIHLLDLEPLSILAFNQHKDYAQRNLTYIRAELRAVQLIRNAAKLCVVNFSEGSGEGEGEGEGEGA